MASVRSRELKNASSTPDVFSMYRLYLYHNKSSYSLLEPRQTRTDLIYSTSPSKQSMCHIEIPEALCLYQTQLPGCSKQRCDAEVKFCICFGIRNKSENPRNGHSLWDSLSPISSIFRGNTLLSKQITKLQIRVPHHQHNNWGQTRKTKQLIWYPSNSLSPDMEETGTHRLAQQSSSPCAYVSRRPQSAWPLIPG